MKLFKLKSIEINSLLTRTLSVFINSLLTSGFFSADDEVNWFLVLMKNMSFRSKSSQVKSIRMLFESEFWFCCWWVCVWLTWVMLELNKTGEVTTGLKLLTGVVFACEWCWLNKFRVVCIKSSSSSMIMCGSIWLGLYLASQVTSISSIFRLPFS